MEARTLSRELARASQAAALAVQSLLGCGDSPRIEKAAHAAMRQALGEARFACRLARSQHEDDHLLWQQGERLGASAGQLLDIAVCPVGTSLAAAEDRPGVLTAIAASPPESIFDPGPLTCLDKLVVNKAARDRVSLDMPCAELVRTLADMQHKALTEVCVGILDTLLNRSKMLELRATGARVCLLSDSDLAASVSIALGNSHLDALIGIGDANDGVLAASAVDMLGGLMQCRLWPRNPIEHTKARALALPLDALLSCGDLVGHGDLAFAATGVSTSEVLPAPSAHAELTFHSLGIERQGRNVQLWRRQCLASD